MRTTLNIPPEIIAEAQRILGYTSKTDTIIFSLRELVRRKRVEELKALAGSIHLHIDLKKSRRRASLTS